MTFSFGPGSFRLLLALIVVIHHVSRVSLGELAVYAFFNLSGFWMARVYRDKYQILNGGYKTFMTARLFRLLPLFLVGNIFAMVIESLSGRTLVFDLLNSFTWIDKVGFLFSNIGILGYNLQRHLFLVPAWSLDVEMQFYLLVPLFILLANQYRIVGALSLIGIVYICKDNFAAKTILGFAIFFYAGMLAAIVNWKPSATLAKASAVLVVSALAAALLLPEHLSVLLGGARQSEGFQSRNIIFCSILAAFLFPATKPLTFN